MKGTSLSVERHWSCPNCTTTRLTTDPSIPAGGGAAVLHNCLGLAGLLAPLVPDGQRCTVVRVDRGDYVGLEDVQTDREGRPAMAVRTIRDDGYDTMILAPMAHGRQER